MKDYSLSDNLHDVNADPQDNDDNGKATFKKDKRNKYYLINKDKINYNARLQREKSNKTARLKDCSTYSHKQPFKRNVKSVYKKLILLRTRPNSIKPDNFFANTSNYPNKIQHHVILLHAGFLLNTRSIFKCSR